MTRLLILAGELVLTGAACDILPPPIARGKSVGLVIHQMERI